MSEFSMIAEITRNLRLLAAYRYPWLDKIPMFWPLVVKVFDNYSPLISSKIVNWKLPEEGKFKCNSDGAYKDNMDFSKSLRGFHVCISEQGLEYCMTNNLLRDSLIGKKIIDGIWEIPWAIVVDIRRIQGMVREHTVEVLHRGPRRLSKHESYKILMQCISELEDKETKGEEGTFQALNASIQRPYLDFS
ncbi:hypothetical protein H5410_004727 [Solanum commersonii]|uniref:Uncharacterized protein n=1 Tax=Solanum commersonii TaxID=4109 RepID=A0A9J6A4M8_SOLCO|nr:hypothetical protein H5410_004727 [Solanum commersonii]